MPDVLAALSLVDLLPVNAVQVMVWCLLVGGCGSTL